LKTTVAVMDAASRNRVATPEVKAANSGVKKDSMGASSEKAVDTMRAPDSQRLALEYVSTAERRSSERTPRAEEDSSLCDEVKVKP
jgi:hypothetical protein